LTPRGSINLAVVETAESFPFTSGVKNTVFHDFLHAELNRILDDPVYIAPLGVVIDTDALEIPQLISELSLSLAAIIDAAEVNNLTALETEVGAFESTPAIHAYLA
tara:strand:+ start:359 stop:676 length:318 start_codon:yes stop_codon:yes gene_type:complete